VQYRNEIIVAVIAAGIGFSVNYVLANMQEDSVAGDHARIASAPAVKALAASVKANADKMEALALTAATIQANQRAIVQNQDRIFNAITNAGESP